MAAFLIQAYPVSQLNAQQENSPAQQEAKDDGKRRWNSGNWHKSRQSAIEASRQSGKPVLLISIPDEASELDARKYLEHPVFAPICKNYFETALNRESSKENSDNEISFSALSSADKAIGESFKVPGAFVNRDRELSAWLASCLGAAEVEIPDYLEFACVELAANNLETVIFGFC